jgi:hypothetical protein
MSGTLDDQYLEWLYSQVAPVDKKSPSKTYWKLFRQLYSKEFIWIQPNDDNRVEDGRDLRYEFRYQFPTVVVSADWMHLPCSMLELLIGLSRRLAFLTDSMSDIWFWQLLDNLNISQCTDARYSEKTKAYIDVILDRVIWRTYEYNGAGGLFPLIHPAEDQRNVELWFQLNSYLLERS